MIPCTNYNDDPLWYAPDLIEQILLSRVPHEIGLTRSATSDFSPACSNSILVRRELEESVIANSPIWCHSKIIVYPFNRMGHMYMTSLPICRSRPSGTATDTSDFRIRSECLPACTSSTRAESAEATALRLPGQGEDIHEAAVARVPAFHLWFHPSLPRSLLETELLDIVRYIDSQRREGGVWVAPMAEIASYCEARNTLKLEVQRTDGEMTVRWRGSFRE